MILEPIIKQIKKAYKIISLNKNSIDEKENKKINIVELRQFFDLAKNLIDKK